MNVYMDVTSEQIAAIYAMADRPIQTDRGIVHPTSEDITGIFSGLVEAIHELDTEEQFLMYGTDRGLLVYRDVQQPGFYQFALIVGSVHIESAQEEGGDECVAS